MIGRLHVPLAIMAVGFTTVGILWGSLIFKLHDYGAPVFGAIAWGGLGLGATILCIQVWRGKIES